MPRQESVTSNVSPGEWAPEPEPPPPIVSDGMPRLMPTLASVEPAWRAPSPPRALVASTTARQPAPASLPVPVHPAGPFSHPVIA